MKVKLFPVIDPSWDPFLTNPVYQPKVAAQLAGMVEYSPFWDAQLSWFPNAYVYVDSYAIYTDSTRSPVATDHPEWILKDGSGNKLYIPWGSPPLPQYAGDIGSLFFTQYIFGQVLNLAAKGYAGVFFDDVNMNMQISDGASNLTPPLDPRTKAPMDQTAWEAYFAKYVTALRSVVKGVNPNFGIIHNSVWYFGQGHADPSLIEQIKAADYIYVQRGFSDGGITGGSGQWSLEAYMDYMDWVHSLGPGLILGEGDYATRAYSCACYFLVTNGNDFTGFGNETPDVWTPPVTGFYATDLGNPKGPRARLFGPVWVRYFDRGLVLVNEPGAGTAELPLPTTMIDSSTGAAVSSVTLQSKQGGVYLYQ